MATNSRAGISTLMPLVTTISEGYSVRNDAKISFMVLGFPTTKKNSRSVSNADHRPGQQDRLHVQSGAWDGFM